ncbi:MAG: hypothetical protein A2015_03220 [Spirochaetes bacterium GWF1_31_7]|nr:MAG: hypothetical protein A2Y30_07305 [Spirochaetes bacterium GWE1_32_154]OHD50868.1 MAG: hypothetical protein A2015_03220 [Spirochaetes bacterium GWF1_31_7]OHD51874.1 MAG: hypothetical protein A2Y29_10505 [Spirochaetes bacterium GWE2_31_10]HBD96421.1 hypothetical protein [Spirochaetia bacterium]HBI38221.1 hypothetical protein [Spirochaetia bacterium]
MNRLISAVIILISLTAGSLFAENIYLFGKTSFTNAQFWERQISSDNTLSNRKVMSNLTGGSLGVGVEWVIWDIGVKRGSRIFLTSSIDLVFLGLNYMGATKDDILYNNPMTNFDIGNGAMYTGFDFDVFAGGTFPKLDLKWGFGSNFYFMFPNYSNILMRESEQFAFFATPSIFIAYDIFIPNSTIKITPMLKTGITTVPLIPDDFQADIDKFSILPENWYSGLYIDLSVSISFKSFVWKK